MFYLFIITYFHLGNRQEVVIYVSTVKATLHRPEEPDARLVYFWEHSKRERETGQKRICVVVYFSRIYDGVLG